jgi:sensor histidine kinase YesM
MNNQRNGGIGLINVNSRLKLIYGEGIKITSEGEKTTVKFVIRDENQGGN